MAEASRGENSKISATEKKRREGPVMRRRDEVGNGEDDNGGLTEKRVKVGNGEGDNEELREKDVDGRTSGAPKLYLAWKVRWQAWGPQCPEQASKLDLCH